MVQILPHGLRSIAKYVADVLVVGWLALSGLQLLVCIALRATSLREQTLITYTISVVTHHTKAARSHYNFYNICSMTQELLLERAFLNVIYVS